jgi:hypothetical protein
LRLATAGLIALFAVPACRSAPDPAERELAAYRQALVGGSAVAGTADAVARAELERLDPRERAAAARARAREYHAQAAASADPIDALAREEVADALLARSCPTCARERIPVLLQLARLYAQRADAAGLAHTGVRTRALEAHELDAERLTDWSLLKQLGELCEKVGDFERAARIERSLLDAKLQILDAAHPQVTASRARIAELERRAHERGTGEIPAGPPQ